MAYNTAYDLESLVVNTKAATVYAAHEQSLFLGGQIIPVSQIAAGSTTLQVPLMSSATAQSLANTDPDALDDFSPILLEDTKVEIPAKIYAARHVLRDLGGIDPSETGRVLGNAIQSAFDTDVIKAMGDASNGLTEQEKAGATTGNLELADIWAAVETIRGNGETGQLYGIVPATQYAALLTAIGNQAYAGGDWQTEAMRNGYVGQIAGVNFFVSSYLTGANTPGATKPLAAVFSQDAMRIGMYKNVDLEVQRRAEAVGNDIVASLHAGVGVVDADRGVMIVNDAA